MPFLWAFCEVFVGLDPQKLEKALPKSLIHLINKTRQNMQKIFSKYLYIPLYFDNFACLFLPKIGRDAALQSC